MQAPSRTTPTPAKTLYRRQLPAPAVAFSSREGRRLFQLAMAEGGTSAYWHLAEQFHTQSEPAYCGLGSLVMALNALAIDPLRKWTGVWRWYSEEMLDCCRPLSVVKERGINFDGMVCLARCNGATVEARHADEPLGSGLTEDEFRQVVIRLCAFTEPEDGVGLRQVLLCNYSRRLMNQTGGKSAADCDGMDKVTCVA